MARHAVPAGEEHALVLQCPCRPELATMKVGGRKLPVVRHRSGRETPKKATRPRAAPGPGKAEA
jgi:hypothetical protein